MCRSSSLYLFALFAQLFNRDSADKHCCIRTWNAADAMYMICQAETDLCYSKEQLNKQMDGICLG